MLHEYFPYLLKGNSDGNETLGTAPFMCVIPGVHVNQMWETCSQTQHTAVFDYMPPTSWYCTPYLYLKVTSTALNCQCRVLLFTWQHLKLQVCNMFVY